MLNVLNFLETQLKSQKEEGPDGFLLRKERFFRKNFIERQENTSENIFF